ncbi:MAG: haloalkane dehalogenase [Acidimicrobiia bacterium]|nr:haloalkane dehalogenase [Acidimicrobiia bacterium]
MDVYRTPDSCFDGLADFAWEPVFTEVPAGDGNQTLRVAHVEAGPPAGPAVLCMHGEPSWSYLYRHMLPVLADAGLRAIAPDLVGFGRSDKPVGTGEYTYARHVDWMLAWLRAVDLTGVTLVCQDWGGLIGLRLVTAEPQRFARVVVANTFLPTGDRHPGDAFLTWRKFSQEVPELPVGAIVNMGCVTDLPAATIAAYDAPFPEEAAKDGARAFPLLVPISPDDPEAGPNRAAWEVLRRWDKPFLTAFSDSDPITRGGDAVFQTEVPGAAGMAHTTITGAGHFLQEERGPELARVVVDLIRAT